MTPVVLPGPSGILPGLPDAIIDLKTEEGAKLVDGTWRYLDAEIRDAEFKSVGSDLGPSGPPNSTLDVFPHAEIADFDDSDWQALSAADTELRLGAGKVSFSWYRIRVTVPEKIGNLDAAGTTIVFEIVIDDYAEVWVDGELPVVLGQAGGPVVSGFNVPNRVVLTKDAHPGESFQLAVFGINGPISKSPENYIWVRSATLDFYSPEHGAAAQEAPFEVVRYAAGLDAILNNDTRLEQIADGFVFTEGPIWAASGHLLFSSPNTNLIYRWDPSGSVDVFRTKSGYTGVDIGEYTQPGSNGLTFDPDGRLTICEHGNRRVTRIEPHGNLTVMADAFEGKKLNSPNDLVYRSDGMLFFTDPPFGLPAVFDDPRKQLPFSGVFRVDARGVGLLTEKLQGPNGLAFSPDEKYLYVGDWDLDHKAVMRYGISVGGEINSEDVLVDLTSETGEDAIDGLKVDEAGNVYICGPGGVWIVSPDGEKLGLLRLSENPHNLAFGDQDGRTLFVTALTGVYRLRLGVAGIRPQ